MAVYTNTTLNSPLTAVEFTPVAEGNFTFFYVDSPIKTEAVKQWLASIGQEIIAEAQTDGHPVIVTHGKKGEEEITALLAAKGDKLKFHHKPQDIDPWMARGLLGISGQGLQLASSVLHQKMDWGLMFSAASNIAANIMSISLGAQRTEDPNRLRFLKEQFNTQLQGHVAPGAILPNVEEKRYASHHGETEHVTAREKLQNFLQRHSVRIGEIGLRYIAALGLAYPMQRWGKAFGKLRQGGFGWQAIKDAHIAGSSITRHPLRYYAGIGSIVGKTIALFSKAEDPFDPNPKSWLDTLREKVTFRLGGAIEAVSFGLFSVDAFKGGQGSRNGDHEGQMSRLGDYLSGTGGSLFTAAYVARHWAKFGVRDVDMNELYAHISDSLAQTPPEKLPQLMAECAASLKEHFKDQPMDFGAIYRRLMTDMYRYHHIVLDNLGEGPKAAPMAKQHMAAVDPKLDQAPVAKHTLVAPRRATLDLTTPPAVTHAEAARTAAGEPSPIMSA